MELAPHRPPAHAAATTNDERSGSMDERMERQKLELRLDCLEFLVARLTAETFHDAGHMQAWTDAMDLERQEITAAWLARQPDTPEMRGFAENVMADHARVWDDLLSSVRVHFGKLPPAASNDLGPGGHPPRE